MGKPDNLAEIISPGGSLQSEIENCGVDHSEDTLVSHNIAETPSTNVDLNAGCGAHIKDEVPIRFEGLNLPGMDVCSRQEVSGVLNWTEALTSTELQLDQSLVPCISSSRHVLQLNKQVVETNSDIHADEMMDIDSFLGSNVSGRYSLGDLQLANNLDKDKEQRENNNADIETTANLSLVPDTMVQVDSFSKSNSGEDLLVENLMLLEDLVVEPRNCIDKAKSLFVSNDTGINIHLENDHVSF